MSIIPELQEQTQRVEQLLSIQSGEFFTSDISEALKLLLEKRKADIVAAEKAEYEANIIANLTERYQDEDEKKIVVQVLQNAQSYWNGSHTFNGGSNSHMPFGSYMKITARVMNDLLPLRNIVSLQPLSGPVGLIYQLVYSYDKTYTPESDSLIGLSGGRRMSLEIISRPVEAQSARLQAGWTIEAKQDLENMHGIDLEAEIARALGAEISSEMINEILSDLGRLAKANEVLSIGLSDGEFTKENYVDLGCQINRAASDIARTTRRGAGNVIVTSPLGYSFLASGKTGYRLQKLEGNGLSEFQHVGNLVADEDRIVYRVFTSTLFPLTGDVPFLVAYAGRVHDKNIPSSVDVGYVYAPYVPLLMTGIVINPVTFQPLVSCMTRRARCAYQHVGDDKTYLAQASDYYRLVTVTGLKLPEVSQPQEEVKVAVDLDKPFTWLKESL